MSLRATDTSQTIGSFDQMGRTPRLSRELLGLSLGLLVALLTAILAAGGAGATPTTDSAVISLNTPSTALFPALSATAPPSTPNATVLATATPDVTSLPSSTPMPSPLSRPISSAPTSAPTQAPTPDTGQVIGYSVEGRPITAYRIGDGLLKVTLVGDIHGEFEANTHLLAQQLLEYFRDHADQVPAEVSLWIVPTMNPDGLATGRRWNANDVDLNRNADTDLDGCAGNDWAPDTFGLEGPHPGAGGANPFSEPEARAIRDFMADAWIAVFYHSAAGGVFLDTCQRHLPSARLADVLSEGTGYPIPEGGWASYPITGDMSDYLAGEGVAAVTVELSDHENSELDRNLAGVQALLASADEIVTSEANAVGARHIWLDEGNTGTWHYAENSFIHPIALEVVEDTAYLLDGGRVLALPLDQATIPDVILVPGDVVRQNSPLPEGVRVLEPLDLAADSLSLLALDRAGDVYRYDPATATWAVMRYDRPTRDTYDHYFVALAGEKETNYLLETSHEQVWRFTTGEMGRAWAKLPQGRDVDLSSDQGDVYVLTRAMNNPTGDLLLYRDGQRAAGFQPDMALIHPRQVIATKPTVYVLDRAGRRLLAIDPENGALQALHQFRDRQAVSAVWADPSGERLILAGRDTLYFYGEPERQATIQGGPTLIGPQPHDITLLGDLRGLSVPIEGATITKRDFQMPGAPRHYRLGVHEGIDFYGYAVGVAVNRRTPVRAVADGVVIRALTDYQRLTPAQAEAWAAQSHRLGYTPPDVLDGYRGRQIWIDHGGGVVSRYAHLSSIQPGIVEGARVEKGQIIAMVGNSGTPASVQSDTDDVHLHLELWVGNPSTTGAGDGHFVGQFLRPIEAREWLERILR